MNNNETKNLTICVAGHIDHGKTTLVKQLTGKDLDVLIEEKNRQITINLGFAFLMQDGIQIGLVDLPGHEKFIKNMIAGVNNVQAAILVVACDDGVMPQTREHLNILKLLGVKTIFLVLTKSDLVDESRVVEVEQATAKLLKDYQLQLMNTCVVSKNEPSTFLTLRSQLFAWANLVVVDVTQTKFRLDVDRVFNLLGKGTIITGTSKYGSVHVNDWLNLAPLNLKVEVKEIQINESTVEQAKSGQRTALRISGVDYKKINRGFVVYQGDSVKLGSVFDGILTLLDPEAKLKKQQIVSVYAGTRKFLAKLKILGPVKKAPEAFYCQLLKQNDELYFTEQEKGLIKFEFDQTIQTGFQILRVGQVLNKKQIPDYCQELEILNSGDLKLRAFLALKNSANLFVSLDQLPMMLTVTDLQQNPDFLVIDNQVIHRVNYLQWTTKILAYLTNFHQKNPLLLGVSLNSLYQNFVQELITKNDCQLLLGLMQQDGLIKYDRGSYALKRYDVLLSTEQAKLKKFILKRLKEDGFKVKNIDKLASKAVDEKTFKMMLKYLVNLKSIVMLDHGFYVAKNNFDKSLEIIDAWFVDHQQINQTDLETILRINPDQAALFWAKYLDLKVFRKNGSSYIINEKREG